MTAYEKCLLAVGILGGLVLAFLLLDAMLARPVYGRTQLAEPDAGDYTGHHSPEWLEARS